MTQIVLPEPSSTPDSRQRPLTSGIVIAGVVVLLASFMVNAMDRQIFYPLLPEISAGHDFSLSQGGTLATGFTLGMALAGLPTGYFVDRLSRKAILILSILLYSAGTIATPLASGFGDMIAYRLISGFGEGMQATALFAALCAYFFHRRALMAGLIGASFGVGVFLGPIIGTKIALGYDDWRLPFFAFGAAGVVIAALVAIVVPRRLTETTTGQNQDMASASFDHVPAKPVNRNTLALTVTSAVGGLVFYGFISLYPTFLRGELGFTPGQAALAVSMVGVGAIMALPAGWIGDRFDQRWVLICTFLTVAVVGWFVFHGPNAPGAQYGLAFLMGTFAAGFVYPNCNTAMQRAVRPHQVGRGTGQFMASYYLGAAISGFLLAKLVGGLGWADAGLVQFTLVPFVAVLALLFVDTAKFNDARLRTPR
ncbi:MAG: MFS transporter [Haloechinothrix sp.]